MNLTSLDFKVVDAAGLPSATPGKASRDYGEQAPNGSAPHTTNHLALNGHLGAGSSSEGEDEVHDTDDDGKEMEAALDVFGPEAASQLNALTEAVQDPGALLQPSSNIAELARSAAKLLFDYGAGAAQPSGQSGAAATAVLPELYVEGFDPEQIWLQVCAHCSISQFDGDAQGTCVLSAGAHRIPTFTASLIIA